MAFSGGDQRADHPDTTPVNMRRDARGLAEFTAKPPTMLGKKRRDAKPRHYGPHQELSWRVQCGFGKVEFSFACDRTSKAIPYSLNWRRRLGACCLVLRDNEISCLISC
jgi:hypothetical protein